MATGLSKTKWNGDEHDSHLSVVDGRELPDVCLAYSGKRSEEDILDTIPSRSKVIWTALPVSGNPQGHLYFGDNLPILADLLDNSDVAGKVRLVYIDPPFATRSVFQSRTQQDAYHDLLAGAHYIEFLRARLILLRELLAKDGSIYVHLDQNMAFHMKVVMDEVFGVNNFRSWITRKKCNPKNYTKKTFGNVSDFILFYTKSDRYVWSRPHERWSEERADKEYQYVEEGTGRRFKKVPIHAPGVRNGETGKPWRGMNPPPGKHWQFTPKTLDEFDEKGEIYWSANGNPRRKVYLDASEGIPVQDIWLDFRDAHNQNIEITGYPTEKNPDLLERIINASSNEGDLVLDCFSGSGTTLSVAAHLKRRWIGIDRSPEAIRTTLRRFAQGTERMGDFVTKRLSSAVEVQGSLPLFRATEESTGSIKQSSKAASITDFQLWVTEAYHGELKDILGSDLRSVSQPELAQSE